MAKRASKPVNNDKEVIEKLKIFIRQNSAKFLDDPNISSIGVGYKINEGIKTNELCIQFTVDNKVSLENLADLDTILIPEKIVIDGMEIATDVIQRKYCISYTLIEEIVENDRKSKVDPIMPGISISHIKGSAGTAGCIVYGRDNNVPYILSNWHVLHGEKGKIGDIIVQPGPHDDNRVDLNHSGVLIRSHLGIAGDCAISSIDGRSYTEEIYNLGTRVNNLGDPELLDKVVKSGRTTAVTYGVVQRIHTIVRIYYGDEVGYQDIGCFEIGVDIEKQPADGEISKPGDSGSCWLFVNKDIPTDILAGLHFGGESEGDIYEHALACYPKSVFEKLDIMPSITKDTLQVKTIGYNINFLEHIVSLPKLNDSKIAYELDGSIVIDYTHFSLALHKERKFASWVAWNIDGNSIKSLSRKGLKFRKDPRIPSNLQIGNEIYSNNGLDRGHIARRADLIWGSLEEAKRANSESFFFTNINAQIEDFNQSSKGGIWGKLEDAVFDEVNIDNLKISVIGGPIFQENDRLYRGTLVPKEFFKVIIYEENGTLKSKSFILTQNLDRLEVLDLDEFKVYESTLNEIEERCNFSFDAVLTASQVESLEQVGVRKPIQSLQSINW